MSHFPDLLAVCDTSGSVDHLVVYFFTEDATFQVVDFSEPNVDQVKHKEKCNESNHNLHNEFEDLPV